MTKVDNLSSKVLEIEKSCPFTQWRAFESLAGPQNCTTNSIGIESFQNQIRQLADSVNNQQRLLEQKERESSANNMVVLGIEESRDINKNEDTLAVINDFLETKLEITSIKAVGARKLGRRNELTTIARPILIIIQSTNEKTAVSVRILKLAGTNIFIKYD